MEIIRLDRDTNDFISSGTVINGIEEKLWVERYSGAGEFELTARASSNLRNLLPLNSFVTHDGSYDIMVVENHEASSKKGQETQIKVSGRSLETIFEKRVIGMNRAWSLADDQVSKSLVSYEGSAAAQVFMAIHLNTFGGNPANSRDAFPGLSVVLSIVGNEYAPSNRVFKIGSMYKQLLETLAIDDLGFKVLKPGPWAQGRVSRNIRFMIHDGTDVSDSVVFSHDEGDLDSSDYFWSSKNQYNGGIATGKWVGARWDFIPWRGFSNKILHIDASDIDGQESVNPPVLQTLRNTIRQEMINRIIPEVHSRGNVGLIRAEVSRDNHTNRPQYRRDYDIGDIVTVHAEYNETAKMRVVEHVEVEDKTGAYAYPTLSVYEGV